MFKLQVKVHHTYKQKQYTINSHHPISGLCFLLGGLEEPLLVSTAQRELQTVRPPCLMNFFTPPRDEPPPSHAKKIKKKSR